MKFLASTDAHEREEECKNGDLSVCVNAWLGDDACNLGSFMIKTIN